MASTLRYIGNMILTFCHSNSWINWWRLSSSCKLIKQLLNEGTSIVLYEQKLSIKSAQTGEPVSTKNIRLKSITSKYCVNAINAQLADLIQSIGKKRQCSIIPQQEVFVSDWIGFPEGQTTFPVRVKNRKVPLNTENKVHVLIEANYVVTSLTGSLRYSCQIDQFGIPKVWTAGAYFAFIIETDVDHFSKMSELFLHSILLVDDVLEVFRLETVTMYGLPYKLVNQDKIPITEYPISTTVDNIYDTRNDESDDSGVYDYTGKPDKLLYRHIAETPLKASILGNSWLPIFDDVFLEKAASTELPPDLSFDFTTDNKRLSQSVVDANGVKLTATRSYSEDASTSLIVQRGSTTAGSSNASQFSVDTVIQEPLFDMPVINSGDDEAVDRDDSMWKSGSSASLLSSKSALAENTRPIIPVSHKGDSKTGKPPTVLIYSESPSSVENMKITLSFVLHRLRYTIYSLTLSEMLESPWLDQAALVVICGNVPLPLKPILISYLLKNDGKLLCVCSDLLESFLPSFKTAEVKPDEVVNFAYGKWQNVSLLHHIFCYQPTPHSSKFSMDESPSSNLPPTNIPPLVEIQDEDKVSHRLRVEVLAAEKTWQTPTLLLANDMENGSKIVLFSQVHLELDPDKNEEMKGTNLRLEVLADLLSTHFGLHCSLEENKLAYVAAYFLGKNEKKSEFLTNLSKEMKQENILKTKNLTLHFCGKGVDPPEANAHHLPVLVYDCPKTFSTVEYFENLTTEHIGRLVIYMDVVTSSMYVFNGPVLEHGLVAIPRQMTGGLGRGKNSWIAPDGCAMYTVQLHIPMKSILGERLSLMQHIVSLSIVSAIHNQPGYENLGLGLKWPNDIYAGGNVKIGGVMIITYMSSEKAVCNVGVAVNLDNSLPTTCINDLIAQVNNSDNTDNKLPKLSLEKFFAIVFNEMENMINTIQSGGLDQVFDLYYKYWLHSLSEVQVMGKDGISQRVTIIGLDEYGFLKVKNNVGEMFSVHPDGNSFNMLSGLIAPK